MCGYFLDIHQTNAARAMTRTMTAVPTVIAAGSWAVTSVAPDVGYLPGEDGAGGAEGEGEDGHSWRPW